MEVLFASPIALGLAVTFIIFFIGILVVSIVSWRKKKSGKVTPPPPVRGVPPPVSYKMLVESPSEEIGSIRVTQSPPESGKEERVVGQTKYEGRSKAVSQQVYLGAKGVQYQQPRPQAKMEDQKVQAVEQSLQQVKPQTTAQPERNISQAGQKTDPQQATQTALTGEGEKKEAEHSEPAGSSYVVVDSPSDSDGGGRKRLILIGLMTILLIGGLGTLLLLVQQRQGVLKRAQVQQQLPVTPTPDEAYQQATASAVPAVVPQAEDIKIYDLSWNLLTNEDLKKYKAGESVRIVVVVPDIASVTKARIRIKQGNIYTDWNEIEQIRSVPDQQGIKEFYFDYLLPPGPNTFTVEAEIYGSGVWR